MRTIRTQTPRELGKRSGLGGPPKRSPRPLRTSLWGRHLHVQQLVGPPGHRQLSLELGDPAFRPTELSSLNRRETRFDAGIDQLLSPPRIDRLVTDSKIDSDPRHQPSRCDQIQDAATELGWITVRLAWPPLRASSTTDSSIPTPRDQGKTKVSDEPEPVHSSATAGSVRSWRRSMTSLSSAPTRMASDVNQNHSNSTTAAPSVP